MSTRSRFKRSLSSISRFDDVAAASASLPGASCSQSSSGASQRAIIAATPSSMLSAALLEIFTDILMPRDPERREQLFSLIWKELRKYGLTGVMGDLEGTREVRNVFKLELAEVVKKTIASLDIPLGRTGSISPDRLSVIVQPRVWSGGQPSFQWQQLFQSSRYMNDFEELKKIGKGAYGSVYKVRHRLDGSEYAVKKIWLKLDENQGWYQVLREVKCLAALCHDSVVRYNNAWLESYPILKERHSPIIREVDENIPTVVQDRSATGSSSSSIVFEDDSVRESLLANAAAHSTNGMQLVPRTTTNLESLFIHKVILNIQMELCGRTLKDWLYDRNFSQSIDAGSSYEQVDQEKIKKILKQMLSGVEYIHENDMIHRDLKPGNIFMTEFENGDVCVKIGDFGLARNLSQFDDPMTPSPRGGGASAAGEAAYSCDVGTPLYAAPELSNATYDEKVDLYSIGVIMFELYHPVSTESERLRLLQDLSKKPLPALFQQTWPEESQWIKKLVSQNADDRPSAAEVLASFSDEIGQLKQRLRQTGEKLEQTEEMLRQRDILVTEQEREIAALRARLQHYEVSLNPAEQTSTQHNVGPSTSSFNLASHSPRSIDNISHQLDVVNLSAEQSESNRSTGTNNTPSYDRDLHMYPR